jgi:hydroxymethylglutaryl-CoA reductase
MDKTTSSISFSKLTRNEKVQALAAQSLLDKEDISVLQEFWMDDDKAYLNMDKISENVISHFYLPFSVAPGFLISGKNYSIPMVTDESSVVAAASAAAKFWSKNGGFQTRVLSTTKIGQIHFNWRGSYAQLQPHLAVLNDLLTGCTESFLHNMKSRGGGLRSMEFLDLTDKLPHYYQVRVSFDTVDAMGANIINTCLEAMAKALKEYFYTHFLGGEKDCDILMAILSNYTPDCLVESKVECAVEALQSLAGNLSAKTFANRFKQAVDIAHADVYRATTHNKGIMNGIDAVLIATGNDFRSVEAACHAYATRDETYKSLTTIEVDSRTFAYTLRVPLAVGTVGGLTSLHPMVRTAFKILGKPTAAELMQIVASAGLANNFSAVRALITSGIQQGHMKFHLYNILDALGTSEAEKQQALTFFKDNTVSHSGVAAFIRNLRQP